MKTCNQCRNALPEVEFGKDKRNKDGLQGKCNNCCNKNRREKYKNNSDY